MSETNRNRPDVLAKILRVSIARLAPEPLPYLGFTDVQLAAVESIELVATALEGLRLAPDPAEVEALYGHGRGDVLGDATGYTLG
ncbi:MAG TPA: hypothetical protein VK636_07900 [Gemmatimonadaceae bacterium]|nr:hypothetical protein [Gemmatimonadaceae bacterium]